MDAKAASAEMKDTSDCGQLCLFTEESPTPMEGLPAPNALPGMCVPPRRPAELLPFLPRSFYHGWRGSQSGDLAAGPQEHLAEPKTQTRTLQKQPAFPPELRIC